MAPSASLESDAYVASVALAALTEAGVVQPPEHVYEPCLQNGGKLQVGAADGRA